MRPADPTELEDLRARLEAAENVVHAISAGEVDAVVVSGERGDEVHILSGADSVYRLLIEAMNEGAMTLSEDGVVLYCNVRMAQMLGQPLERVQGSTLRKHLPLAEQPVLETMLMQARAAPCRREIKLTAAEDRLMPVYLSAAHLRIDGAQNVYCLVVTDLTAQRHYEQTAAAERLSRLILEQAAEAIVVCDEQGRVIRASEAAVRLCTRSPLLRPFAEMFPLQTGAGVCFQLEPVLRGETRRDMDLVLNQQGQQRDLILNAGPLLSGSRILGCVVTLTDITDRTRNEQELQRRQSKLQVLFDLMPAMIWFKDTENRIVRVNQRAAEATGKPVEEIEGRPSLEIYPTEAARFYADDLTVIRSGTPKLGVVEMVRDHDGKEFWIQTDRVPYRDKDGKVIGIVVMAQDITERARSDKSIRRLNRVYAVLSGINSLIVRTRDRDELFREACRIAIDDGHFKIAWIGLVDRSAMTIVPAVTAGADVGFIEEICGRLSLGVDGPAALGPTAKAVNEKRAAVVNDVEADPAILRKGAYLDRGVRSYVVLPVLVADETVAILSLYATEAGYFDEAEMTLLRELADDIGFALDNLGKQAKLDYLAYYDVLTGLANRALFHERLEQAMANVHHEQGRKLALVLLDIERFKTINDTFGRQAGDTLLREVAARMSGHAVDTGRLARIEIDHFAVMVPEVPSVEDLARQVNQRVGEIFGPPFHIGDIDLRVSARFGIAVNPADGADADTLFRHAEVALKKAKAGGERYLFYTQKMNERVAEKLALENKLRQALDHGEFVLHYQPKVNLASGELTGAEALIRWNDPSGVLVPPRMFIPILEETGLIHEVGRWALRKAVEDYLRWRRAGLAAVRVAVNVSPLQLRDLGFAAEIAQVIGVDSRAASGLELEITESLIMENVKHSISTLRAIRDMGVRVAIDDFGTGYSSLSYLAKLPVDTLKIDRSFVIDMNAGAQGLALVATIISLGHSLNLSVVAEGVETEEQSRQLCLLGCDEIQGYVFSKPVPAETFESAFLSVSGT